MLKRICLLICLTFFTGLSHATVQIKDQITLLDAKGGLLFKSYLQEFPLSQFLSDKGIKIPHKFLCSANYSGYTADWIIRDGRLYLENYYSGYKSGLDRKEMKAHSKMKELFPTAQGPVLAEWYTGPLHFGSGKIKEVIHFGHTVLPEYLHIYQIRNGIVESQKTYKYPESIDDYKKESRKRPQRLKK